MDDLNANMLSHSNSDTKFYRTSDTKDIRALMDELSLKLVNTGPTHHSSSRDNWIDILLVHQCETVKDSNREPSLIPSRHGWLGY